MTVAPLGGVVLARLGVATGGTWVLFAPLVGVTKETAQLFVWTVAILVAVGAIGCSIYVKAGAVGEG
jgi:hypothetical protein